MGHRATRIHLERLFETTLVTLQDLLVKEKGEAVGDRDLWVMRRMEGNS